MKAVVLDQKNNESVLLLADGTVCSVKGVYKTGTEIEWPLAGRKLPAVFIRTAAAAACFVFLAAGIYSYQRYTVYASVEIGTQARIRYELNRSGQVLRISALTEEAEEILDELSEDDRKGSYEAVLEKSLRLLYEEGVETLGSDLHIEVSGGSEEKQSEFSDHILEISEEESQRFAGGLTGGPFNPDGFAAEGAGESGNVAGMPQAAFTEPGKEFTALPEQPAAGASGMANGQDGTVQPGFSQEQNGSTHSGFSQEQDGTEPGTLQEQGEARQPNALREQGEVRQPNALQEQDEAAQPGSMDGQNETAPSVRLPGQRESLQSDMLTGQ